MTRSCGNSIRVQSINDRAHCSTESETVQMKEYMKDVSVEDAIRAGRTDSICWDCKNAMRGGCSWTDPEQQKPVKGWEAKETDIGSYIVYSCPEFKRCTYACGRYRTADDYILALEIAVKERKTQLARLKKTPDNLRRQNAAYKKKNNMLQNKLDAELWYATVHMSD